MNALELISANNGWAMAVTGAIIVMTGLATLSFIISNLHKVIALIEKKQEQEQPEAPPAKAGPAVADVDILNDLAATTRIYKPLTVDLGKAFELSKLYQIFSAQNLPHPHLTIRSLKDAGYLVPAGEGQVSWKSE